MRVSADIAVKDIVTVGIKAITISAALANGIFRIENKKSINTVKNPIKRKNMLDETQSVKVLFLSTIPLVYYLMLLLVQLKN